MSIQPLFVFDGPHKPPFKRNKRTAPYTFSTPDYLVKNMLKLFGVPYIVAPGEAEAECALLQKEGVVDAVLSEDVDTLMFGCTKLLRNWNGDASRKGTTPTHVDMYDAHRIKTEKSMDREGIVLAALMSGGDYMPEGIPSCGIKTACEAARGGFGSDLSSISKGDKDGLREWRERLEHELQSNESGFFRTRHKALKVPESFPDTSVLYYYSKPVVSAPDQVERYRRNIQWNAGMDVQSLRNFVVEAFEWRYKIGARHFVRGLAPSRLAAQMGSHMTTPSSDQSSTSPPPQRSNSIRKITKQRCHPSSDGMRELRISFVPADVVGIDLDNEVEQSQTASYESDLEEDDQALGSADALETNESGSPLKKNNPTEYDPTKEQKDWMWEVLVKRRMPRTFAEWEASQQKPEKVKVRRTRKPQTRAAPVEASIPKASLDSSVRITKLGVTREVVTSLCTSEAPTKVQSQQTSLPTTPKKSMSKTKQRLQATPSKGTEINPWSLARGETYVSSPQSEPRDPRRRGRTNAEEHREDAPIVISSSSPPALPSPSTSTIHDTSRTGDLEKATRKSPLNALFGSPDAISRLKLQSSPSIKSPDPFYSPRLDLETPTPTKQPPVLSSSPSLPSPSIILALTAPAKELSTNLTSRKSGCPARKGRQESGRRRSMPRVNVLALESDGVEVLDLTHD